MKYTIVVFLIGLYTVLSAQMPVDTSSMTYKYQNVIDEGKTKLKKQDIASLANQLSSRDVQVNTTSSTEYDIKAKFTIDSSGVALSQEFKTQLTLKYKAGMYFYTITHFKIHTAPNKNNTDGWNDFLPLKKQAENDFDKQSNYKAYLNLLSTNKQTQTAIDKQITDIISTLTTALQRGY